MISGLLLTLCSGLPPLGASPEVPDIHLSELTRLSDVIVLGRVERIFEVEHPPPEYSGEWFMGLSCLRRVRVAEVSVLRGHEGAAAGDKVYFFADSTWTCDITDAVAGETALLFLYSTGWVDHERASFRSELARRTHGAKVYTITHHGRGRMPRSVVEGTEYVTFWPEVRMPSGIPIVAGPEPQYDFIRNVQLERLEERIGEIVASQLPFLRARCRVQASADHARGLRGWDLRIWGDGHGLLVTEDPRKRVTLHRELRFPAERMEHLGEVLAKAEVSGLPRAIGDEGSGSPLRQLAVRTREEARELEILTVSAALVAGDEPRREAARALELWAEIRGLFQEPGTLDHRSSDRPWIEAWR